MLLRLDDDMEKRRVGWGWCTLVGRVGLKWLSQASFGRGGVASYSLPHFCTWLGMLYVFSVILWAVLAYGLG